MQTDSELYEYRKANHEEDGGRRCRTCEHCYFYMHRLYCNHVLAGKEVKANFVCNYYDYDSNLPMGGSDED